MSGQEQFRTEGEKGNRLRSFDGWREPRSWTDGERKKLSLCWVSPSSGTTELPTVRVQKIWARDRVCEAGAGQRRMLIGTKARRNDIISHSKRRDSLVLCLLKPKPHICQKKKPSPTPPTTATCCATQPLSLQEEISGNVRQGTRSARRQLLLQRAMTEPAPSRRAHRCRRWNTTATPALGALPSPPLNSDAAISGHSQMSKSERGFLQGQFPPLLPPSEASPKSQCAPPAPLCAILH